MLSNVKLKLDDANFPELIFDFFGGSMVNWTSEENAKLSVNPNTYMGCTEIYTEKADCKEKVFKEINIEGNFLIVIPFFDEPFMAKVVYVKPHAVKFGFHSNDKINFPDQYLMVDEIKSIHAVTRVSYNMVMPGGCHCAVDGDYCGEQCNYPENNPDIKGGEDEK